MSYIPIPERLIHIREDLRETRPKTPEEILTLAQKYFSLRISLKEN